MKIVITGATGYIGSHLTSMAIKRGHDVVMATRLAPSGLGIPWIFYDLKSQNPIVLPVGTSAVLHLAANTNQYDNFDVVREVEAAKHLIKEAENAGARFVFVSSHVARSDAPTLYGKIKWRIEEEVLSAGGYVVRPGQVYGGACRGLFGMIVQIVQKMPILPRFVPAPNVQPIHVDDLTVGLLRIVERQDTRTGVYCLGSPKPIPFSVFLAEIANSRLRCWRLFVPAPVRVINALSIAIGKPLQVRLGLERLNSLFNLPVMDTSEDVDELDLVLRPLCSGMHPSGSDRRRCLLREGRALLTYVLNKTPSCFALRRYVMAIEKVRDGQPLDLPNIFLAYPILFSLFNDSMWVDKSASAEFFWRLDAATLLAEATPAGSRRFLGIGCANGYLNGFHVLTKVLVSELCWRVLRFFLTPLVRLVMGHARTQCE